MARFLFTGLVLASIVLAQGTPDFSGEWRLDPEKSDDGEALILGGLGDPDRMSPKNRRAAERRMELGRALASLEIRQSPADLRLYDEADNVRIYYIDGKKHPRETPWGQKLETVTKWEGGALRMRTDGKDLGEFEEIYAMDGSQLVYTVKIRLEDSESEVVIRTYYTRAPSGFSRRLERVHQGFEGDEPDRGASAFGFAGSPCRSATPHPSGRNAPLKSARSRPGPVPHHSFT